MSTRRGTTNKNMRGSVSDRRARKQWLLDTFGDGTQAPCAYECGAAVTLATITVDRYPVPGCRGGRYTRDNIRPACGPCNSSAGSSVRRPSEGDSR